MLIAERYERIVQLVNERGSIRVAELSSLCQVTEETIRRDLDRLETLGRLRRSHGGAVSVKDQPVAQVEVSYAEREIQNVEHKKQIAEAAVQLIEPKDRILLDASTTAWYMARSLPDIPLTVLTNSIRVAVTLASKDKIDVISTGGSLAQQSLSFVGPLAERALETYYVNKLFVSCKGVHPDRGISESNESQARIKQNMLKIADQTILLADASKFGVQAFAHVGDWSQIDHVISDERLDARLRDRISQRCQSLTLV
ncbi:DeoR/GlpR family transcriptional regulator of sugar metabolism [Paenibacillus phyllosphaerae]|uniref:DeoR/GlpR family transcriptional regulator of sugar metabolism n=1 Tax=Paenibacillus phyllosphaerae TaxID=274593 RepID=A0A7W5AYU7_9BACL|nr:DeoR/GlpR family DNA-binding transcription regulator [Paenibacillus phyllosphaerae]MBB3111122.1 DeoR/GlpR family transcriptional regulator of sugar metabolism [Paenibacillus phyllosphaerae]